MVGQSIENYRIDEVLGYGHYDFRGEPLQIWGSAPPRVDETDTSWKTRFTMNRETQRLVLREQPPGRYPKMKERFEKEVTRVRNRQF